VEVEIMADTVAVVIIILGGILTLGILAIALFPAWFRIKILHIPPTIKTKKGRHKEKNA
jgi:hypothetical protein